MQAGTVFRALLRPGTELSGFLRRMQLSARLQVLQNAVLSATRTIPGMILSVLQKQGQPTAKGFRQTPFGTVRQALPRPGMMKTGFRLLQELTIKIQALQNAVSNVPRTTTGQARSASLQRIRQNALDFLKTLSGIRFPTLHRLGAALSGFRQMPALSTKLRATANAVSSAKPTTLGTALRALPTK